MVYLNSPGRENRTRRPAAVVTGRFERGFKITLRDLHAADLFVAEREIALPVRFAGVFLRQTVENGEAAGMEFERGLEIALRLLHAAKPIVGRREIALPV